MKVAWFTPLSKKTGVSRYSIAAVKALSEALDIDVWAEKRKDNLDIEARVIEVPVKPSREALKGYDLVVYNFGNNIEHHGRIYDWYKNVRGVVILHDKLMHDFFAFLYIVKLAKPEIYLSMMRHYYGAKAEPFSRVVLKRAFAHEASPEFHLLDQCVWNASGVIVHSRESLDLVKGLTPVPSRLLYFPYESNFTPAHSKKELGLPDGKKIAIQYGHITPNKYSHRVLESIASDRTLKESIFFVLAGDNDSSYGEQIKDTVKSLGLQKSVLLTGYLDDALLQSYFCHSDICVNLRFPSAEGASWSLVEQMSAGKVIIAARAGFFDEMPDDCLLKIDHPFETRVLAELMKKAAFDEQFSKNLAGNAYRFAANNFRPASYRDRFMELVKAVMECKKSMDEVDRVTDSAAAHVSALGLDTAAQMALQTITASGLYAGGK